MADASADDRPDNGSGSPPAEATPLVPVDKVAQLEKRVQDDPRGALDAWLALMAEHRCSGNTAQARQTYERFLAVSPQAAEIWVQWLEMELEADNFSEAERIFSTALISTPNLALWTKYLDYVRRRNDLNDGNARQVVFQAYDFALNNIGLDKDSGKIWADYIQFLKSGPGTLGGTNWEDLKKMDQIRSAYQKAICVPIANVNNLWKEYDQFEMSLNKPNGRKNLAERSPSYMTAKSAYISLENTTRGLQRTTLPILPPAPGFDGYQEYMEQVEIWKRWIQWEKSDPLYLKEDEKLPGLYQKRILYVYRQALMALRFWPEMWLDAAEWCLENNIIDDKTKTSESKNDVSIGLEFLIRGIEANPESVLLALRYGDYIESTYQIEDNDKAKIALGQAVRAPYNKVLDTLYDIINKLKDRETAHVAQIQEAAKKAAARDSSSSGSDDEDDEEEEGEETSKPVMDSNTEKQIQAVQQAYAVQTKMLSRTISFVWIALIRAMRRIQGKGKANTEMGGMRQVFQDARQRGRLTSDVYAAVAHMEWTIYKEAAGGKIFDRGAKLFPEDEDFALEHIKYLHSLNDFTNARVLFERVVSRLTSKPENVHKAKQLYVYFHKYESQFGELAQISKLEKRMAELFPEDPKLSHFSARFSTDKFDPITARVIVSPAAQLRPPRLPVPPPNLMPSIEQHQHQQQQQQQQPVSLRNTPTPAPQFQPSVNSPKRPLATDEDDGNPPRKIQRNEYNDFVRGASPLKGAAGRRLDQQRRMQGTAGGSSYTATPAPIARDITFLLGLIPRAETYDYHRLNPSKVVGLLQGTNVPEYSVWKANAPPLPPPQPQHHRNVSGTTDFQYGGYGNIREESTPRAGSPYTQHQQQQGPRLVSAAVTYRQSSLRPGSAGSGGGYEPPPAVVGGGYLPTGGYGGGLPPPPPPPGYGGQGHGGGY
ncbi:putative mRNA 3'-end-processing protein rna-14 [Triangularia verruculosa]|uniref:mRNA 3'-end-processing protein RNA14 n=1 Tax=Triangularia verruculosa TaxID=2587418 RepID=A0AAN6XNB6_9PEZI|nr:putative mRNA 3'-end-processing protein rna-14 [Triangularia verruculosa]